MTFTTAGEDISRVSLYFSDTLDFFFIKKIQFWPGGRSVEEGVKEGRQGTKKNIKFSHRTCGMCEYHTVKQLLCERGQQKRHEGRGKNGDDLRASAR